MASRQLGFAENFALSGAAAVISKTASAPIERVKLLVQNQDEMMKAGRLSQPYKGVIDCTVRTFRAEGLLPFWRSNFTNCARYFPTQALNFAFKDKVKALSFLKLSRDDSYVRTFAKNIVSGGIAGSLSLCFVYSLDYARTRLANDAKSSSSSSSWSCGNPYWQGNSPQLKSAEKGGGGRQFNGLIDVYMKTLKSDGMVGLYRGFVLSCVGIFIYRGLYFGLYDSLKPIIFGDEANVFVSFCLGYAVTVSSGLLSYPIDTIRRRMMMTSGQAVKYKGSMDCAMQIVKNEGFMSMMKGAGANILRGVAGAGVLAGFDSFKAVYIQWRLKR